MVGGCPAELTTDINSPPSLSNLGHFTILPPAPISSDRSGFTTHRVDDVPGGEEGERLDVDRGGEEEERAEHDRCVHHWPHQTPQLSPHLYLYLTRTAVVLRARWVFNFILDLAVSLRTSTPDQHRAVTGEVESEAAFSRHGAIVVPSCHGTGRGREKPLRFLPGPPCPAGTT